VHNESHNCAMSTLSGLTIDSHTKVKTTTHPIMSSAYSTAQHSTTHRMKLLDEDDDECIEYPIACDNNDHEDDSVRVYGGKEEEGHVEHVVDISELIRYSMPKPPPPCDGVDVSPIHRGKNVAAVRPYEPHTNDDVEETTKVG
jgi:hypothetical protein